MSTTLTAVGTFVMAFLILAGSLGAVFAAPAREAAASHSTAVTLRSGRRVLVILQGVSTPYRWTNNGWVQGSTYSTDRYGNFALSLSRDHHFFNAYG